MTNFEQDLSGANGVFWKNRAEKQIADLAARAEDEIRTTISGAAFWVSNGNFIPEETAEILSHTDFIFDIEETAKAREEQESRFLENYRANHKISEEEKAEIRAAFGDTPVYDIITGERVA